MNHKNIYTKGRGSQLNPANRFLKNSVKQIYVDDLPSQQEREETADR